MEMLNKKQAAKLLNVSVRQIDFLRAKKNLPWVAFGQCVRFDREELEAWVNENARRSGGVLQGCWNSKEETKATKSN